MKVNLLLNSPNDIRSGYLNIDPFADGKDARTLGEVLDIDSLVDDGEAEEIVAHDILDYVPAPQCDEVLSNWLRKLAYGGKLSISTVDLRDVSRAFLSGVISIDDANGLLHGEQTAAWDTRKSTFTVGLLAEVLRNKGYKIVMAKVENFRAIVTCERAKHATN